MEFNACAIVQLAHQFVDRCPTTSTIIKKISEGIRLVDWTHLQ